MKLLISYLFSALAILGQISITSPPSGVASGNLTFTSATAPANTATVDYWIAGHSIVPGALPTTAPYTVTVNSTFLFDGPIEVVAVARDSGGNYLQQSSPLRLTISNFGQTTANITNPTIFTNLSNTVTFSSSFADSRGMQAFVYSIDGQETAHQCLCGTSYNDTLSVNTLTLSNGIHYFSVTVIPNNPASGAQAFGSAQIVRQFTVSNTKTAISLEVGTKYVWFRSGYTTPVTLSPTLLYNDGTTSSVSAICSSDTTSVASVTSPACVITPGASQGQANITVTSSGFTSNVIAVNVTTTSGFPQFTRFGPFSTIYTPGQSLFVRSLFFTDPAIIKNDTNPSWQSIFASAGVNAVMGQYYSNPADDGSASYAAWMGGGSPQASIWYYMDQAKSSGFANVCQGDNMQRSTNEGNCTTGSSSCLIGGVGSPGVCSYCQFGSYGSSTTTRATEDAVTLHGCISLSQEDEVGGNPVDSKHQSVATSILGTTPHAPLTWEVAATQSNANFAVWNVNTVSEYSDIYFTYSDFRPVFPWGWSLRESYNTYTNSNEPTVLGRLPYIQIDKPRYMEGFPFFISYYKETTGSVGGCVGGSNFYHPQQDDVVQSGFSNEQVTSQIFFAAALGFGGLREYGYDGQNGATDLLWQYNRCHDSIISGSISGQPYEQAGATPFTTYQPLLDLWTSLSNGFNAAAVLEPYFLSPMLHAPDLGPMVVTGVRQLANGKGRMLITINMQDTIQTITVPLSGLTYAGSPNYTRYRVTGLLSTKESVATSSSTQITLSPGESIAWVFTAPLSINVSPSPTETQFTINYTAPDSNSCTVTATNLTDNLDVYDVDPTLFSGANLDLQRTYANGYRWYTLLNGNNRTVTIGTHNVGARKALNGKWYSTALEMGANYQGTVTCNQLSGTFFASTPIRPLGMTYPEYLIPDQTGIIPGLPVPTIDYTNRNQVYVDPITGLKMQRLSSPVDLIRNNNTGQLFIYAQAISGSSSNNQPLTTVSTNSLTTQSPADYNTGYSFTPSVNGQVTKLWIRMPGTATYPVRLYSAGGTVLSTALITGVANTWVSANITAVNLTAGSTYVVAVHDDGNSNTGQSYYYETLSTPITTGNITINSSLYSFSTDSIPTTVDNVHMYGEADVTFTTGSGGWTNPNYALTNQVSSTLASTSTLNTPLFLAWGDIDSPNNQTTADVQAVIYGNAAVSGTQITACITEDSGQSCASSLQTITLNNITGIQSNTPNTYPKGGFSDWGPWSKLNGNYDVRNHIFTGVSATGTTVSMAGLSDSGFNTNRPSGAKFKLSSCSGGSGGVFTVSSVNSPTSITTQETGLSATNCTYQDLSSGVLVSLINSGTVNLSATFAYASGTSSHGGSNGNRIACNPTKISSITTGCLGETYSNPQSGQICQPDTDTPLTYLIMDNGEACLQGTGYAPGIGLLYPISNPWIPSDPYSLLMSDVAGGLHKATYNNGGTSNFIEYQPSANWPPGTDHFNYSAITPPSSLDSQLATFGGPVATANATGIWGSWGISGVIGGNIIWTKQPGGQDTPGLKVYTDSSENLLTATSSFSTYPFRWGGLHSGPAGSGNYSNLVNNVIAKATPGALFGGPYSLQITGMYHGGVLQSYSFTVSGGTSGNPTILTVTNSDLFNNTTIQPYATCSGSGVGWTSLNTTFKFTVTGTSTISVPISTTGSFPGSFTCTTSPPILNSAIQAITTSPASGNPARITFNTQASGEGTFGWLSNAHHLLTGDSVVYNSNTTPWYVNVIDNFTVDLYSDSLLSVPVSPGSVSPGSVVNFAQVCPAQSSISLPGALYFDSGTGSGIARCITIRVNGEPCSDFAGSTEHSQYPCPQDPTNTSRSSLGTLNVGDAIEMATNDYGNPYEEFLVIQKVGSIPNIDLTLMRWYGNDPTWGRDTHTAINNQNIHPPGWVPIAVSTLPLVWINMTDASAALTPQNPIFVNVHGDFGCGPNNGMNYAGSSYSGGPDSIISTTPLTVIGTVPTFNARPDPWWLGSRLQDTMFNVGNNNQTYPNRRYCNAAGNWNSDWLAINNSFGKPPGQPDQSFSRTLTLVGGTNHTYQISNAAVTAGGATNPKTVNYIASNNGHQVFQDISGPASAISDSTPGTFCIAFQNNECVSGSSSGNIYISTNGILDPGHCYSNNSTIAVPCLFGLWGGSGWAIQSSGIPYDQNHSYSRFLTFGFSPVMWQQSFQNWIASPDAKWGLVDMMPLNQTPDLNYSNRDWWFMYLPQYNPADTTYRNTYYQYPITLLGGSGQTIRVRFGYAENGDLSLGYCTSRQEACYTTNSPTATSPFLYGSESQSKTTCTSGCIIKLPLIPGRIAYYQIGTTISGAETFGPIQTALAP